MNKNDLKKLITEIVNEVVNEDESIHSHSYSEKDEIDKIKMIKDTAESAWHESDLTKIKSYLLHIHNLAEVLIDMHGMDEGYGAGDPKTDPKSAGRWKVHFPSEKDWSKNKKSLDKVFDNE